MTRFSFFPHTIMPGSSTIYGLLCCYNKRHIVPNKNRTYTFDVDFVVGFEGECVIEQTAIMTHFVLQEDDGFVENAFYTVYGKVASIDSLYVVEDGVDPNKYQFVIDAEVVRVSDQGLLCCSLLTQLIHADGLDAPGTRVSRSSTPRDHIRSCVYYVLRSSAHSIAFVCPV